MTTANEELKSTVRNWITSRIRSTNDDYLASNDYVKFHRIEEESATSGVYSTILKDTDTSGQIEFVDTLDEGEAKVIVFLDENNEVVPFCMDDITEGLVEFIPWSDENLSIAQAVIINIPKGSFDGPIAQWKEEDPDNADKYERIKTIKNYDVRGTGIDKCMKVVGLNMFNDAIQSLESAVSGTTNDLKDYIKFSSIEASTEESGVYHTVLSNDKAAGQLEFVDTLDDAEQGEKYIVCLNANNERCPMLDENGGFVETLPLTEENEAYARDLVNQIAQGEIDVDQIKQDDPDNAETYDRMAAITHMEIQTIANPDKKIKIVGKNMFDSSVGALTSRIAELEARLNILISAFEADPAEEP